MSAKRSLDDFLAHAQEEEIKYDWAAAAVSYANALSLTIASEDYSKAGDFQERIGYCLSRRAFQAEAQEQFESRMLKAMEAYKRACALYKKMRGAQKIARMLRCRAVAKYLEHWLTSDPTEKRKLLDDCLELEAKALRFSLASGDMLEYGSTYSTLPHVFWQRARLEWSGQTRKRIYERGVRWGKKAVTVLSEANASHELAKAYFTSSTCQLGASVFIAEPEKQEKNYLKAVEYLHKAVELAEKTSDVLFLGFSNCWFNDRIAPEDCRKKAEEALECGERTQDTRLIALSLSFLTNLAFWKAFTEENPKQWRERMAEVFQFYERAHRIYSSIPITVRPFGLVDFPYGYVAYYEEMAERETVIEKKLDLLKKAEEAGIEALRLAESSDLPEALTVTFAILAGVQAIRAQMDSDIAEKRHHLELALKFKERVCQIRDEVEPFMFFNRGVGRTTLARHKMDLADVEADPKAKPRLLEDAVVTMEQGLKLLDRMMQYYEEKEQLHLYAVLRRDQDCYATVLTRLYDLTNEPEHLRSAIEILRKAIDSSSKLDLVSRRAESYWKIANAQEILGEHLNAAENFGRASEDYMRAAEKIPQLKSFYTEYASYMDAWAELEKSRHNHRSEDYARAGEHYRKSSRHLKATKRWSYLSSYYFAWALLEQGEQLGRLDRSQDAMKAFDEAGQTFGASVQDLRTNVGKLESSEEREEASKLATIARFWKQYCQGRVLMEAAKLSNKKGDRVSSAENFASAARLFGEIAPNLERAEARKELQVAATFCHAWAKMALAEERRDAVLYRKAAALFRKAGQTSRRKITGLLAFGNGCFCEALELGMKFKATSNMDFFGAAKSQMENAADYYQRAGFEKPTLWVEATKRLFDAYVYAGQAEAEADPAKRVRFCRMAEKCLALSAKLHGKAGYSDKREEVLQNLERMRKERKLALSLNEILTAPAVLSSTMGVSMSDSTAKAAGLNQFEVANIRARLSAPDDFVPGEAFQVKLDVVNVGKKPGLLVRVEGLTPRRCKILKVPSSCVLEDDSLNMQGKRLSPLSVESITIWAKAEGLTGIDLSPRVVYVDESGDFKTIKADEISILPVVEFESKVAHSVFSYLVDAYVEDSVKKKLSVEQSGWRSFPQIMRGAGVSKKSLYGAGGRLGYALSELRQKRLVDIKTFRGRGRGGHILRVRIHSKKAVVRRYVKEKAPDLSV